MSLVRAFTPACSPISKAIPGLATTIFLWTEQQPPHGPPTLLHPASRALGKMQPLPRPSLADHWPQD